MQTIFIELNPNFDLEPMLRLAYMFGIMYYIANVFQTSSIKLSIPNTQVNEFRYAGLVLPSTIALLQVKYQLLYMEGNFYSHVIININFRDKISNSLYKRVFFFLDYSLVSYSQLKSGTPVYDVTTLYQI
jgi:hypothetical protein